MDGRGTLSCAPPGLKSASHQPTPPNIWPVPHQWAGEVTSKILPASRLCFKPLTRPRPPANRTCGTSRRQEHGSLSPLESGLCVAAGEAATPTANPSRCRPRAHHASSRRDKWMPVCAWSSRRGGGRRSFFVMSTPTSGDRNVPAHARVHLKRSTWLSPTLAEPGPAMSQEFGCGRADIQTAVPAARLVPSMMGDLEARCEGAVSAAGHGTNRPAADPLPALWCHLAPSGKSHPCSSAALAFETWSRGWVACVSCGPCECSGGQPYEK